ncbi:MAG: RNA polymerase subunit sigma-24 [Sneathiella sp.]|jgi:RNA polymerase sigma-70 factor (ECF subfamily)|uniref:RNA polymerase sigma factor n=1 Tax=Sneathiella sp. TaxID=1964365 RepID=UPI000C3681C5|nr:RNA polymerase sigma factor [Sneathiella sp.]MAL80820.1 RNA polymerase subunit sigma-24 [Sneathiella sp.]|tara:strand:+ start:1430 stop:2116 length:687 start_codon:yes stop_codon:yes gene_type:complete
MPRILANIEMMDDIDLVRHASQKDAYAVRTIITRNNQRLFRTAWSVLRNHADAEDVVQEAYLKAFNSLESYSGRSSLSTWLTRIVYNAAIDRKRAQKRRQESLLLQDVPVIYDLQSWTASDVDFDSPESKLIRKQFSAILKQAVARLPDDFRSVFVLRDIEGMSVSETAEALQIKVATVKSRLFRARRDLRKDLAIKFESIFTDTITFAGADCDAMTNRVLAALNIQS